MDKVKTPILLRYGGAAKPTTQMNAAELQQVAASVVRRAKEKAFYKGLPIYYVKENRLFAEYADGRKVEVKKLQ